MQNLDELAVVVTHFRAAVQTLSLFGDRKTVWLKDVNFIADTVTGRSEGAQSPRGRFLQALLEGVDPAGVAVLRDGLPGGPPPQRIQMAARARQI